MSLVICKLQRLYCKSSFACRHSHCKVGCQLFWLFFSIRSVRLFYFSSTRGLSNSYFYVPRRNFRDSLKILFVPISRPCKLWTRFAVVWVNKTKWLQCFSQEIPCGTKEWWDGVAENSTVILIAQMQRGWVTYTCSPCDQSTRGSLWPIHGVNAGHSLVARSVQMEQNSWYLTFNNNPRFLSKGKFVPLVSTTELPALCACWVFKIMLKWP